MQPVHHGRPLASRKKVYLVSGCLEHRTQPIELGLRVLLQLFAGLWLRDLLFDASNGPPFGHFHLDQEI